MNWIVAAVLFFSGAAQASVARLKALGQDSELGSLYLVDARNFLHNPAYLNHTGSFIQLEFGDEGSTTNSSTANSGPQAQGGFFHKSKPVGYGMWLGHDSLYQSELRSLLGSSLGVTFLNPDNTTELLIAGQGRIDWGASMAVSQNKDRRTTDSQSEDTMTLRAGIIKDALDASLVIDVSNQARQNNASSGSEDSFTGEPGVEIYTGYKVRKIKFFGVIWQKGASGEVANVTHKLSRQAFKFGIANVRDFETGLFFWEAALVQNQAEYGASGAKTKITQQMLPLRFGIESKAAEWLTLRGAIKQNFLFDSQKTSSPNTEETDEFSRDSSEVSAGATLHFEKFVIDGVLSTEEGTGASGSTGQDSGELNFTRLASYLSLTYQF